MISELLLDNFRADLSARQKELQGESESCNIELESFARACCEILCESGMLPEEPEFLMIDEPGYRVDAICWPEEDQPIVEFLLFLHLQKELSEDEIKKEITSAFNKSVAILRMLCKPTGRQLPDKIEKIIGEIHTLTPNPESILLRIITDVSLTSRIFENKLRQSLKKYFSNDDIDTDFRFSDINDICQISMGGTQGPSIEFLPEDDVFINCFKVHEFLDHDVYLAAFPGRVLASAFKKHGQRLLQKNVRAFLGLKGKKNKKIKETLIQCPQRFLAYNNGLTITVNNIKTCNNILLNVDDMQIVNGGQTVAVIADTFKGNNPQCLESVIVTAKIIHVKNQDEHVNWIEKIAETSNTQNAIKDADLSSHNPIYLKVKELSHKTIFRKGTEEYRWYFCRVRNEYKADYEHYRKQGHIKLQDFESKYPEKYMIEKGIIARADSVFSGTPWMAARGEAKYHADFIANIKEGFNPDSEWYRELTGKIILIRHADWLAKRSGVREGRSCIVEYSCALFSYNTDFTKQLNKIHNLQNVPDAIGNILQEYINKTIDYFAVLDDNRSTKEHAKREETWNAIKAKA